VTRERCRRDDDRGVSVLVVAIVMPAVLFLLMLSVQAGMFWHARQRADAAAARAVAAAAREGGTASDGQNAADDFLSGAPLDNAAVTVTVDIDQAQATVTGTAPALVPGVVWEVHASAAAPVERFIPETERQ
jgi:Flp pilus assembly protein TadG